MKALAFVTAAALGLVAWPGAQAQTASYAIDPTHTFVTFEVQHHGISTQRGRFDKKEGSVQLDRTTGTGSVEIRIDMNSVNTGVAALDSYLKGKDFFDTDRFPTAQFEADRLVLEAGQVTAVPGTLTLRGKAVTVLLKTSHFNCYTSPLLKREVCGGDFEATVQPSAWGLNAPPPAGVPDRARLVVQVEAVRQ